MQIKLNRVLGGALLALIAVNLPLLVGITFPFHDTGGVFKRFYFFYNEFFMNRSLPLWAPYGEYGIGSGQMFLGAVSAPAALLTLIGGLLRIESALWIFNLSVLLEQAIFIYGVYLTGSRLYRNQAAVAGVCLAAVCGTVVTTQIEFNFQTIYLLPLVMYFVVRFLDEWRPLYIVGALLCFTFMLSGMNTYLIEVPLFTVTVFGLALLALSIKDAGRLRECSEREALIGVIAFAVFAFVIGTYYLFVSDAIRDVVATAQLRNPDMSVSLDTFLHYLKNDPLKRFTDIIYPLSLGGRSAIGMFDATMFTGSLVAVFAVYALFKERSRAFIALCVTVLALGALSLGDKTPFAEAMYNWFPFMKYFRHIPYMTNGYKLLLPLIAGYGIDRFIDRAQASNQSGNRFIKIGAGLIALVVIAEAGMYYALSRGLFKYPENPNDYSGWYFAMMLIALFVAIGIAIHTVRKNDARWVGWLIGAAMVFEIVAYHGYIDFMKLREMLYNFYSFRVPALTGGVPAKYASFPALYRDVARVSPLPFAPVRTMRPVNERGRYAYELAEFGVTYALDYNFFQEDPCAPIRRDDLNTPAALLNTSLRVDMMNSHVYRLMDRIKGIKSGLGRIDLTVFGDSIYRDALACDSPKLKLLNHVQPALDEEQALDMTAIVDIGKVPIVIADMSYMRPEKDSAFARGSTRVVGYAPDRLVLDVDVLEDGGAWLYYAEAWHPAWRATINNVPVPMPKANIGFKAVELDRGASRVVFEFDNKLGRVLMWLIVIYCSVFTMIVSGVMAWCMVTRRSGF